MATGPECTNKERQKLSEQQTSNNNKHEDDHANYTPPEPPVLAQPHVLPQYNSITPSGQGPRATHNLKIIFI